eukprot:jgi/Astpho2/3422/Aster-x0162
MGAPSRMQVNPLFSSSFIDSQQAADIPTMEDIDVLLSPMDQQDQIGQRLDLQQQEGGNFDRQTTEQSAEGPQGALGSSSRLPTTGSMLPYSNTLFDGSQPEDSTRPRYVGSLTAKHDPAVKAALAGSDGGSISSSSGSHQEPAGGAIPQKWQPWQPLPQQAPPTPVEVAPEATRPGEEEGEQDVMSTQQLQGLLGKHGYSFHLVEPFSGSGESEDDDDESGDEEDESDGPAAQAADAQAPSRRLSLQRDATAGHRRSRSSIKGKSKLFGDILEEEHLLCPICMDRPLQVSVAECSHQMCMQCAYQMCARGLKSPLCPFCRQHIDSFQPLRPM